MASSCFAADASHRIPSARGFCLASLLRLAALLLAASIAGCDSSKPQPAEPAAAPKQEKPAQASPAEGGEEPPVRPAQPIPAAAISSALAQFNRGAALLEQYRFAEGAAAFHEVLKHVPTWLPARFNLGLAYLNMQEESEALKHLEVARREFETVLRDAPDHLHARFCLGLLCAHLGETEKALECFEAVRQKDSGDPHVAYKCAEALIALRRNDEGRAILEKVVALDPGFISGVFQLFQQYQRSKQPEKALALKDRFEVLRQAELAGGSFVVQKQYGTVGKYYIALGPDSLPLPRISPPPPRILFSPEVRTLSMPARSWQWPGGSVNLAGIAAGDIEGDGDLDLCLTGLGDGGTCVLWINDGKGTFSQGGSIAAKAVSPCFGDFDNDGDLDLWIGCAGPDRLLANDGKGTFTEVMAPILGGGDALTISARLLDADSDGDLDPLAVRLLRGSLPARDPAAGGVTLYQNNRDGTYADIAGQLGPELASLPISALVYDDFDDDRDLDLILFPAGARAAVAWVNDRGWRHRTLDAQATGLTVTDVVGATTGDPDKDGDRDLLIFTADRPRFFANCGRFRFEERGDLCGLRGGTGGQFADMDNDGDLDIVIGDAARRDGSRGPALLINDWPRDRFLDATELDPGNLLGALRVEGHASCIVADFTGDGACDIVVLPADGRPFLVENMTRGNHWIEVDLLGTRSEDEKTRSNNSGIGARVEVKTGAILQQLVVGIPSGAAAMPPLRVHAGLGDRSTVDWLRIAWPDGVIQAELELPADRVIAVSEVQRKTSSCPLLFAWNGSRFSFVADFGGVGGLGYLVAPDKYARPDSTECVRIPHLEPLDGEYVLQILGQLEEVVYLDEAKLIAVDHDEGTEVYPNEMMAVSSPPPRFEIFCFRRPIDPVRAIDHRGADVTDRLLAVDRRYAGATDPDRRFPGLSAEHWIDLDFGDRLAAVAPGSRLILFLQGWVEYGYSSTNFAASQARLSAKAPSVYARRGETWVELFKEVGYPAGIQHTMTLDVTGAILPGDRHFRIASNMELYWDRIFLAEHVGGRLPIVELAVSAADLHPRGYPREYSPDGNHPNLYDYENVDRTAGWKLMEGAYTRHGDVAELLGEADDCYVIMGHGEEITLRFPVEAFGPLPEGRRRTFILKADSYCKDMDLYTAHPDTLSPLPFHGMSGYPYGPSETYPDDEKHHAYRRRFNTRIVVTR